MPFILLEIARLVHSTFPHCYQGQCSSARWEALTALPQMPTLLWHIDAEQWHSIDADERQNVRTSQEERTP
jgi:hypothetical protein